MTFLPIQFWTKLTKEEFRELKSSEILDLIENYLEKENFRYIKRKKDKIVFHKANGWTSSVFKDYLVSGVVRVKETEKEITINNGNWMVFLIVLPFLIFLLLTYSKFSTLDENDIMIIKYFLIIGCGGIIIIRFFAHLKLKRTIINLIKKNFIQQHV